jgi:hypothetical protein
MPFLDLPSPVSLVPLDTPQSLLGQATANNDFLRFLFGNGQGTRIINPSGVPIPVEIFYKNLNEYGVTLSNKFFVIISGPETSSKSFSDSLFGRVPLVPLIPINPFGVNSSLEALNSVIGISNTTNNSLKDTTERLAILCNQASFPKVSITSSKLELIPSMQENIARYMNFSENSTFSLKFVNTSSMYERNYFESWMNTVVSMKTGLTNFYSEYAEPFTVSVFKMPANGSSLDPADGLGTGFGSDLKEQRVTPVKNGQGNNFLTGCIYGIKYMQCYPIDISPVDFSYGAPNITETTVTFAYKYFESPSNQAFLANPTTAASGYSDYLATLKQLVLDRGKVAFNPKPNPVDNLANAVNGVVNAATNISGRIRQIF